MSDLLRIVVADDEPDIRDFFRRFLPRLGHCVVGEACNGRQLVDLCRLHNPDVIITDLGMPLCDGNTAIAELGSCSNTPVIIVSSHDPPEEPIHPMVVDYLVKPIEGCELAAAIEKASRVSRNGGNFSGEREPPFQPPEGH